ncbi:hypothetical protein PAMP_009419 [Pampus punctatissimus]
MREEHRGENNATLDGVPPRRPSLLMVNRGCFGKAAAEVEKIRGEEGSKEGEEGRKEGEIDGKRSKEEEGENISGYWWITQL